MVLGNHTSAISAKKSGNARQKKRYPRSPELEVQPWQAQGSELLYVSQCRARASKSEPTGLGGVHGG